MTQFPNYPQMDNIQPTPSAGIGFQQMPGAAGFQPAVGYPSTGTFPQTFPQQQFPQFQPQQPSPIIPSYQPTPGALPFVEQSYIENILRLNRGKIATVYMNFENSQWGSKIFKGVIEAAGKDHIILSDPITGMRYVLLTIFLNYITFDEEINYEYPFAVPGPGVSLGTSAPLFNVPTGTTPVTTTTPMTQLRKKENNTNTSNK